MNLKVFFDLIRYKSYLKNLIIFLPLFLTYSSWSVLNFTELFTIFLFFCFLTSSIYIINDVFDVDLDKKHKKKKYRPIASGKVSIGTGIKISLILCVTSLAYFFIFSNNFIFYLALSYLITNFSYSFFLKKIKYVDLLTIVFGFIIRIYIGSFASDIVLSNFLIFQIVLFVLFVLICKRREYFFSFEKNVSSKYSIIELNFLSKLFLILNILNYLFYIFNYKIFINSLVLFISLLIYSTLLLRYFVINFKNKEFDPITIYLRDKYLILLSVVYIINFIFGFYGFY